MVGRKYTFLITIIIMGSSTFIVGVLPTSDQIGFLAPTILIALRLLQGLALGGEYGGAATYVAEHAPHGRRGFYTSWIQTTATMGLFMSLLVILFTQSSMSADDFRAWGWRVPFLVSILLLAISVWIRMQLAESPAFLKMKADGTHSRAPLTEAFGQWKNAKWALLALLGMVAGQAVVWYSGQFYALFFLTAVLKVDAFTGNLLVAWSLALGTGGFVLFGWLSDKIGRKPIILGGCLIAAVTYFPVFHLLAETANPALSKAHETVKVVVAADPGRLLVPVQPDRHLDLHQWLRRGQGRACPGLGALFAAGSAGREPRRGDDRRQDHPRGRYQEGRRAGRRTACRLQQGDRRHIDRGRLSGRVQSLGGEDGACRGTSSVRSHSPLC